MGVIFPLISHLESWKYIRKNGIISFHTNFKVTLIIKMGVYFWILRVGTWTRGSVRTGRRKRRDNFVVVFVRNPTSQYQLYFRIIQINRIFFFNPSKHILIKYETNIFFREGLTKIKIWNFPFCWKASPPL